MTYAADGDVTNLLGTIGNRLPSWITVSSFVAIAHAEVVSRLGSMYPNGIPAFDGPAADVVKYAEAKIAAASILEAIRVNLPDLGDAPDRLRADADRTLGVPIPGYPAGSTTTDDDADPETPGVPVSSAPRVSSFTPLSAFPDPYEAARDLGDPAFSRYR